MAAFFNNLFKKFKVKEDDKKKKINPIVQRDIDPSQFWDNIGVLGDGAFGKVYKAKHKTSEKITALKQVDVENEDDVEDCMVEIDILTECKHENIIELTEAYIHDSKLWMYIEFCGGGAVDSIMDDIDKPLTEPQIRFTCQQMCRGLAFLHSNNVIHRDLKAGNVLLTLEGAVKLADFGVSAKNTAEKQKRDSFIGTPYWMAPEVIACETFKDTPYDFMADVWSLGITLIEFAQMHPPNHDMNAMRVLIKMQKADPPTLDRPHIWTKNFNHFLARCMVKSPHMRAKVADLLTDPFIVTVSEDDRKSVYRLVCEANAEVTEIVEDADMSMIRASVISAEEYDLEEDDSSTTGSNILKAQLGDTAADNMSFGSEEDILTATGSDNSLLQPDNVDLRVVEVKDDTDSEWRRVDSSQDPAPQFDGYLDVVAPDMQPEDSDVPYQQAAEMALSEIIDGIRVPPDVNDRFSEIQENETSVAVQETVDDLVEEVLTCQQVEPSVPAVVLRSIQDEDDDLTSSPTVNGGGDIAGTTEVVMRSSSVNRRNNRLGSGDVDSPGAIRRESYLMAANTLGQELDMEPTVIQAEVIVEENGDEEKEDTPPIKKQLARRKSCYKTIQRTRKFVVDGEEVTETTTRVVKEGYEAKTQEQINERRQDIREMKLLAKEEKRQNRDMNLRATQQMEQLVQKFKLDDLTLLREYETDIDVLEREQRAFLERSESQRDTEIKHAMRRIKADNTREERRYRDRHSSELAQIKLEVDTLPKDKRKETLQLRREESELEFNEKYEALRSDLIAKMDDELEKMRQEHRIKVAQTEADFLQKKQSKRRAYESQRWDLEERHCQMRYACLLSQLRDNVMLKRQQTDTRQQRERDQLAQQASKEEAALTAAHFTERKSKPKHQKMVHKQRLEIMKQSLRMKDNNIPVDKERELIKEFEEKDKQRMRAEMAQMERRHERKNAELATVIEQRRLELEQLQQEKKKNLTDQETLKNAELEDEHKREMTEIKDSRVRETISLEQELEEQVASQSEFYCTSDPSIKGHIAPLKHQESTRSNSSSGSGGSRQLRALHLRGKVPSIRGVGGSKAHRNNSTSSTNSSFSIHNKSNNS